MSRERHIALYKNNRKEAIKIYVNNIWPLVVLLFFIAVLYVYINGRCYQRC